MQNNSYTFIDIETPNRSNDKICSIGIIHLSNGEKDFEKYYLVNPEASFDEVNMKIHHIKSKDVIDKQSFNQIWPMIEKYFVSAVIVAHNATFDISVISKTLQFYNIPIPEFHYFCTCEKAKRHLPNMKHNLNILCDKFGINLANHHNAMEDTQACLELFQVLTGKYGLLPEEINTYVFSETIKSNEVMVQKAMNELHGIVYGIGMDNVIHEKEYEAVRKWMGEHNQYKAQEHFKECYELIDQILEDQVIPMC